MRTFLSAAIAAVTLLSASSAFAFTSTGTIGTVTPSRHQIRLVNGDVYRLPAHIDLSRFAPGQRVHVTWQTQNPSTNDLGGDRYIKLLDATDVRHAD